MRRAIALGRQGMGLTRPNPAVGCVLTDPTGRVLGEGFHRRAGGPHAEVEAISAAKYAREDLRGSIAYVTLEPCNHSGKTAPCVEALIQAGVNRVVIATRDPNQTAAGGVEKLRRVGIAVDIGLLEQEAMMLNPGFLTFHMLRRPLVTLKWAMTIDGCASLENGDSKWITGLAARTEVHRRRAAHDAVLAGVGAVLQDDSRLTVRDIGEVPFPPLRIVMDSVLRLPADAPFLQPAPGPKPIIFCSRESSKDRRREIIFGNDVGVTRAEVIPVESDGNGLSIARILHELSIRGVQSVYVEGGRHVAGSFIAANAVDRIECWMGPMLAGGGANTHLGPTTLTARHSSMEVKLPQRTLSDSQISGLGALPSQTVPSPFPLTRMASAPKMHDCAMSSHGDDYLIEGWVTRHLFPPKE